MALCGAVPLPDRLKHTHQSMNAAAMLSAVTKYTAVSPGRLGPAPASDMDKAAALIRSAARPTLMVGLRGADVDACESVRRLLAGTGLPIVEMFQAAGVVSRELEAHYVGRVGLFENQPGDVVVARAGVLITIGYDPVEYDPRLWNADPARTVVHIDSLPAQIDNHYQPALELRGDIAATINALAGLNPAWLVLKLRKRLTAGWVPPSRTC